MRALFAAVVLFALSACGASREDLSAVSWVQRSSEYAALVRGVYHNATLRLDAAIADTSSTACVEQADAQFANLPPAIIVDVDETIVDNSPYNARLLADGASFDGATWNAWVRERSAHALPGAVDFLQAAARAGVTVFYVTNRDHAVEAATAANLRELGFPFPADSELDVLLTKNEYDADSSNKVARRKRVAANYRIVMLCGDDLGDFLPVHGMSEAGRAAGVEAHAEWWGQRWHVLPNPVYGSWERLVGDKMAGLRTQR